MKNSKLKPMILLHIIVFIMSTAGIFSKLAAGEPMFSIRFIVFYACEIVILGIYALGWQQVIKSVPLTTAFANKSVGILWTTIWGVVLFNETLSAGKVIGIMMVLIGSILFSLDKKRT